MFGQAYKCDECGRVQFVPDRMPGTMGHPPQGWFALSNVGEDDMVAWPMWHFDVVECVRDFILARTDMQIQALDAEPTAPSPALERIISEWEAPVDQQEG